MSVRRILPYQVIDGKQWNGATERNHLFTAFADDPTTQMDIMAKVFDVNLGEDFVSMIEKLGIEYLPAGSDGRFEWKLDYFEEGNYECIGAWADADGTTALTSADRVGAGMTSFYLDFVGNPFGENEVIGGMNPNVDRLFVVSAYNVGGDVWRYEVKLAHAKSYEDYYDFAQVAPTTLWNAEAALSPKYWSDRGPDISFRTPARAEGDLSSYRIQHEIAGHMLNDYRPKYFYVEGANGKIIDKPLWISNVEMEFLRKIRAIKANLIMFGRSNKDEKGNSTLIDRNGYEIVAGSGIREQTIGSNVHTYTGLPQFKTFSEIAQAAVVGKVSMANRRMIVSAGEYGLAELSNMVIRELGKDAYQAANYLGDTSGRAFKWFGNEINVNFGQVMGYALINGIRFEFVLDPSKDDRKRNKIVMGNGLPGLASSYQYDIYGFGVGGESNVKVIRRQNDDPVFGVIEGMRGFFNKGKTSFTNPKQLASALDGAQMHFMDPGVGVRVTDPTKVIRYYPSVLPE